MAGMAILWNGDLSSFLSFHLKEGANAKAKSNGGKTAFDYAKENDKLKGTDAFRQLEEASR
jgi:hypothetical protein